MNIIEIKKKVVSFSQEMKAGEDHFLKACQIYANTILEDNTATIEFEKAHPYITKTTWDRIRLVGVGAVDPKVAMLQSDRMFSKLARLPINRQKRLCTEKIPVFKSNKAKMLGLEEMSERDADIAIDDNGKVRTVKEQEKIKVKEKPSKSDPYKIDGNVLVVSRACTISAEEIKKIAKKMGV